MSWANLDLSRTVERSFRAEKASELTLPGAVVLLEGGVVGVIAAKIYAVGLPAAERLQFSENQIR